MLENFHALYSSETKVFYVLLAQVEIKHFTKSTFMNMVEFAEKLGAQRLMMLLSTDHPEKRCFKKIFSVIDAIYVRREERKKHLSEEAFSAFSLFEVDL